MNLLIDFIEYQLCRRLIFGVQHKRQNLLILLQKMGYAATAESRL